jgi:hypothetical protein
MISKVAAESSFWRFGHGSKQKPGLAMATMQPLPAQVDAFSSSCEAMVRWWCQPHNVQRADPPLGVAVCSIAELVADLERFSRFLDSYLDRSSGTRARLCDSLLCCLKWVHAPFDESSPPPPIATVRRLRSQLQKVLVASFPASLLSLTLAPPLQEYQTSLRSRSSREQLAAAGKWASWSEILAAAGHVTEEFTAVLGEHRRFLGGEEAEYRPGGAVDDTGELRRRLCQASMDCLLVKLYTAIPPGEFCLCELAFSFGLTRCLCRPRRRVLDAGVCHERQRAAVNGTRESAGDHRARTARLAAGGAQDGQAHGRARGA